MRTGFSVLATAAILISMISLDAHALPGSLLPSGSGLSEATPVSGGWRALCPSGTLGRDVGQTGRAPGQPAVVVPPAAVIGAPVVCGAGFPLACALAALRCFCDGSGAVHSRAPLLRLSRTSWGLGT